MTQLLDFFFTPAHAETPVAAAASGSGNPMSLIFMLAIFFLFFYFVMWRPQNKRAREHKALINALSKGDEVITSGGLLGKIHKITEQYVSLSVDQNAEIVVQKSSIVGALPKGTLKSLE